MDIEQIKKLINSENDARVINGLKRAVLLLLKEREAENCSTKECSCKKE